MRVNSKNTPSATTSADGVTISQSRTAWHERMDQIKTSIVELSSRDMENALRVMRRWLNDRK